MNSIIAVSFRERANDLTSYPVIKNLSLMAVFFIYKGYTKLFLSNNNL